MKSEIFPGLENSGICHADTFITADCQKHPTKTLPLIAREYLGDFSYVRPSNNVICNLPSCDFELFLLSLGPPLQLNFYSNYQSCFTLVNAFIKSFGFFAVLRVSRHLLTISFPYEYLCATHRFTTQTWQKAYMAPHKMKTTIKN